MTLQVLFIHGAGAQDGQQGSGALLAQLRAGLEAAGGTLLAPRMPDPERPTWARWREALGETLAGLRGRWVLAGHLLGGSVLLKYLAEEGSGAVEVAGVLLAAAPYRGADADWDAPGFALPEDFPARLAGVPRIVVCHGRDDTVVPFAHAGRYLARLPAATLRAFDGHGHGFVDGGGRALVAELVALAADGSGAHEPVIRPETAADAAAIATLTRAAFASHPFSQQTEAAIIAALRVDAALTVSLVAECGGQVVGHIAFSPVQVSDGTGGWFGLGPMAVAPPWQRQGIGSALLRRGLEALRARGARGCVVLGEPGFYGRFGFAPQPGLTLAGVPPEYFLALAFDGGVPQGGVAYHPAFAVAG